MNLDLHFPIVLIQLQQTTFIHDFIFVKLVFPINILICIKIINKIKFKFNLHQCLSLLNNLRDQDSLFI